MRRGSAPLTASKFAHNVAANYAGNAVSLVISILFVPLYIRTLGVEAYGLVGLFVVLQSVIGILGLGIALNRELATLENDPVRIRPARGLLRTLEIVYGIGSIIVVVAFVSGASLVSARWLDVTTLPARDVATAVALMGLALAFQLPFGLYSAGLLGLQKQIQFNVILVAASTIRAFGTIFILWNVSASIQAFFVWQAVVSALQAIAARVLLWRALPHDPVPARFDPTSLVRVWRFAAGASAASALVVVLGSLDRLLLSRLLTLEAFGYYAIAGVVASAIYLMATPVFIAVFPRLSRSVSLGDEDSTMRLYREASQLVSTILLPVVAVIALFSEEVLLLWTRSASIAVAASSLLTLLSIGSLLVGLNGTTYQLQLARGETRKMVRLILVTIVVAIPLLIWATGRYGAVGAAGAWVALNLAYTIAALLVAHHGTPGHHAFHWYVDLAPPLLASVAVAAAGRVLRPRGLPPWGSVGYIALVSLLTLAAAVLATPTLRARLRPAARKNSQDPAKSGSQLKILLVTNALGIGGIETNLILLVEQFTRAGHDVTVAAHRGALVEKLPALGARYVPLEMRIASPSALLRDRRRIRRLLHDDPPDVVHVFSATAAVVMWISTPFTRRKPVVVASLMGLCNSPDEGSGTIKARAFMTGLGADKILIISPAIRRVVERLPLRKTRLVDLPVVGVQTHPTRGERDEDRLRETLGVPRDHRIVMTIGRLDPSKSPDLFIAAAGRLKRAGTTFVIIGGGPLQREVEAKVRKLETPAAVVLVGELKDAARYLQVCDVYVRPGVVEGFVGITVLEAQAYARPVIAFETEDVKLAIEDGITGALVPPGDTAALADAIGGLLDDPARAARLGLAGQALVRQKFAIEAVAAGLVRIYRETMAKEGLHAPQTRPAEVATSASFEGP